MKNMSGKLLNGVTGFSNDASNMALSRVVVVPFTSNISRVYPGNALVNLNGKTSKLMADQIMTVDKSRLKNYIGMLNYSDMVKVAETVRMHLEL